MLTREEKQKSTELLRINEKDTGSSAVQVSILSSRIQKLSDHLKINKKDKHSQRGLIKLIEQRRKHMKYLKGGDIEIYDNVVKALGLRR